MIMRLLAPIFGPIGSLLLDLSFGDRLSIPVNGELVPTIPNFKTVVNDMVMETGLMHLC